MNIYYFYAYLRLFNWIEYHLVLERCVGTVIRLSCGGDSGKNYSDAAGWWSKSNPDAHRRRHEGQDVAGSSRVQAESHGHAEHDLQSFSYRVRRTVRSFRLLGIIEIDFICRSTPTHILLIIDTFGPAEGYMNQSRGSINSMRKSSVDFKNTDYGRRTSLAKLPLEAPITKVGISINIKMFDF